MSEQENEPNPDPPPNPPAEEQAAASTVKKGSLGVLLLILLSLTWYLLGDRYTPYTSQARVQGYVVGVAPKVAGSGGAGGRPPVRDRPLPVRDRA